MEKNFVGKIVLGITQLLGLLIYALPRKIQVLLGNSLGFLIFVIGFRSSVVKKNLEYAFPNDSKKQKEIYFKSYQSFGNLILETVLLLNPHALLKKFVLKNVQLIGGQKILDAEKTGKGVIMLSSHLGNWEVMAASGGLIVGMDLMLVTKKIKPTWLLAAIERGRSFCKVKATYEPKTLKDILSQLKKGKSVGFVLDQFTGAPVGVRVPFFGIPVGTSLALATLMKRTGATLLPVENYREPDGSWKVIIHDAVAWQPHEQSHYELAQNTAHFVQILEEMIYRHPEQWLWTHRRFKGNLSQLKENEWFEPRART